MGFWTKTERMAHRDEHGNVVVDEHRPSVREAAKQWEREHRKPSRFGERLQAYREQSKRSKAEYRQEFAKAYRESRLKRARESGRKAGSVTWSDRLSNMASTSHPRRQYKPAAPFRDNYNPFGSMFDTGLPYRKHSAKSQSTRYAVVGGKAYPVAGGSKKKKKRRSDGFGGFDIADNWGFI